jgi:pSer/pThr/pTyr-binding forkhead associated (FHA) protein
MPTVVVKTGSEAGRRLELGDAVAIGRQDGDLVLEDPEVSSRHAVLRREGEAIVVEDLDSTNGTFVNGERIRSPVPIGPGDLVRMGRTTLEIEPDVRADDTIVSAPLRADDTIVARPVRPDQIPTAEAQPSDHPVADDDATQPLPNRVLDSGSRPSRSNRKGLGVAAAVVAVFLGVVVIAYAAGNDRSAESDFITFANDACLARQRSDGGVDLSRTPTRGALQHARDIRLQVLGAIRALERSQQKAAAVSRFLSAFEKTNASITRLESVIGADNSNVANAVRSLRGDVRDERGLAAKAGVAECGGVAIG